MCSGRISRRAWTCPCCMLTYTKGPHSGPAEAVSDVAREYGFRGRPRTRRSPRQRLVGYRSRGRQAGWVLMRPGSGRSVGSSRCHVEALGPGLTSFVDCSRDGLGSLLGLAPGRTGACVREWLGEQSEAFRKRIEIVVIDPSAPYASAIRAHPAQRQVGCRHLAPGGAGQPDGHRGAAARHPRAAGSSRHQPGPDLGEPAAAAHRCGALVPQAGRSAVAVLRQL
jgi:hypothetical protein